MPTSKKKTNKAKKQKSFNLFKVILTAIAGYIFVFGGMIIIKQVSQYLEKRQSQQKLEAGSFLEISKTGEPEFWEDQGTGAVFEVEIIPLNELTYKTNKSQEYSSTIWKINFKTKKIELLPDNHYFLYKVDEYQRANAESEAIEEDPLTDLPQYDQPIPDEILSEQKVIEYRPHQPKFGEGMDLYHAGLVLTKEEVGTKGIKWDIFDINRQIYIPLVSYLDPNPRFNTRTTQFFDISSGVSPDGRYAVLFSQYNLPDLDKSKTVNNCWFLVDIENSQLNKWFCESDIEKEFQDMRPINSSDNVEIELIGWL